MRDKQGENYFFDLFSEVPLFLCISFQIDGLYLIQIQTHNNVNS